jgi:hypothetical protein
MARVSVAELLFGGLRAFVRRSGDAACGREVWFADDEVFDGATVRV